MLFASGSIPRLRWLRIQLGTRHRTHHHCQIWKPEPDELDKLERLPLDLRSDAELSPEEEELDRKWCGEGDLAHLHLDGEHTAEEEVEGRPSHGGVLWHLSSNCVGAVEVEADGPVLTVAGCTTSCSAEDSLLQNVLGLPAAVEWWSVCKIQGVKPQPGLVISFGCMNPQMMGELLWYTRFAGKEGSVSRRWSTISRLAHNGVPMSPVI